MIAVNDRPGSVQWLLIRFCCHESKNRRHCRGNATCRKSSRSRPPQGQGLHLFLFRAVDELEYTKLCSASVFRHTRKNYELIFLDIGSLDGTIQYLTGIAAAAQVRVEIVRAVTDLGVPQAVQTTLQQARGEYIVLLNNDTIVTDGWLSSLIALANLSPAIGLVGPVSNCGAPPQLVEPVAYRVGPKKSLGSAGKAGSNWLVDVAAIDSFASTWRLEHKNKWKEADSLGGFCLLIKRAALDRIGPLDKAVELGVFDFPVLSCKAREQQLYVGMLPGFIRAPFWHADFCTWRTKRQEQ